MASGGKWVLLLWRVGRHRLASEGIYTRTYLETLDDHPRMPVSYNAANSLLPHNSVRKFFSRLGTLRCKGKAWLGDVGRDRLTASRKFHGISTVKSRIFALVLQKLGDVGRVLETERDRKDEDGGISMTLTQRPFAGGCCRTNGLCT